MKRFLVFLIATLLAATAVAQSLPPELSGVKTPSSGTLIKTWPTESIMWVYYTGKLYGDGSYIHMSLDCLRNWAGKCVAPPPKRYAGEGIDIAWYGDDGGHGSYVIFEEPVGGLTKFEAWVFLGGKPSGKWYTGCLEVQPLGNPPAYIISKKCPLFIWDVRPYGKPTLTNPVAKE